MVSSMDFAAVAAAYVRHCSKRSSVDEIDPRSELERFLDAADGDEPVISTDVRILLVSADFGREITTTVLWLNRLKGMDVRCVRPVPYDVDGRILLDIQQVLPLPEAADYQVHLSRKDAARDRARTDGRDFTRYHIVVNGKELGDENKRNAVRVMVEQLVAQGVAIAKVRKALPQGRMRVLEGRLTDGEAVRQALLASDEDVRVQGWFCDDPFVDDEAGVTYVLSKGWGISNTEPALRRLTTEFPAAKVTFRRADERGARAHEAELADPKGSTH